MDQYLEFAVDLAREAGIRLRQGYGSVTRSGVGYKGWRNLVTELDLSVERRVIERISEAFPDHGILAEEGGGRESDSDFRWIIDPLDGTTNYVHRHPMYCVSIALEEAGEIRAGVVYAPHLDELFTAVRGQGALFNLETPMRVSDETELSRGLLSTGFAYGLERARNNNLENWSRLSLTVRGLRHCGAAALDLAYVADGRYDGFWELNLNPWDVAAGGLLVQEAGGKVTDGQGGSNWKDGRCIVATNGHLHEEIRNTLNLE